MDKKNRKTLKQKVLSKNTYCVFCGGQTIATTLDHVPSRQMFYGRRRPQGLEVSACKECNEITRKDEQVAAMLARLYPDPRTKEERAELRKIMKGVKRNHPFLFSEFELSWQQEYDFSQKEHPVPEGGGLLNASGPLLNHSMEMFSVKLICALHYEVSGEIPSLNSGIAVRWHSNYEKFTGKFPDEIFSILHGQGTLKQGEKWDVSDQFSYAWGITDTKQAAMYFAGFRMSFSVVGFVYHDINKMPDVKNMIVYSPPFKRVK